MLVNILDLLLFGLHPRLKQADIETVSLSTCDKKPSLPTFSIADIVYSPLLGNTTSWNFKVMQGRQGTCKNAVLTGETADHWEVKVRKLLHYHSPIPKEITEQNDCVALKIGLHFVGPYGLRFPYFHLLRRETSPPSQKVFTRLNNPSWFWRLAYKVGSPQPSKTLCLGDVRTIGLYPLLEWNTTAN